MHSFSRRVDKMKILRKNIYIKKRRRGRRRRRREHAFWAKKKE